MKIREIRLRNFKRFTDTKITDIPPEARVVFLVGPNGCGKSSLIDAVHAWYRSYVGSPHWDKTYHPKQIPGNQGRTLEHSLDVAFHEPQAMTDEERWKAVYVRSAYRNESEFQLDTLSPVSPALREIRINRMIDDDKAVSLNYKRLVSQAVEDVFEHAPPHLSMGEFREQCIGEIRAAIERLFPGLVLNSLGNPFSGGTFRFDKGDSKAFLYKNLSGGEKAVFDLLLDILVKKKEFDDTVFFIDEPDAHLSPALQSALIDEFLRAIPKKSQLWLATHSIGMMRKAREIAQMDPNSVLFIDFEGQDFDLPVTLKPVQPNRPFWKRALRIALDDLAGYVAPERVVICEGGGLAGGTDFDAECYQDFWSRLP